MLHVRLCVKNNGAKNTFCNDHSITEAEFFSPCSVLEFENNGFSKNLLFSVLRNPRLALMFLLLPL